MIDSSGRIISPGYTRVYCNTTRTLVSVTALRNLMYGIIVSINISHFQGLWEHDACGYCRFLFCYQYLDEFECREPSPAVRTVFEESIK